MDGHNYFLHHDEAHDGMVKIGIHLAMYTVIDLQIGSKLRSDQPCCGWFIHPAFSSNHLVYGQLLKTSKIEDL